LRAKKIFISFHNFPYRTYRNCIVMQQSKYFTVNIITVKIEQPDLRYFTNNMISSMIISINSINETELIICPLILATVLMSAFVAF